MHRPRRTTPPTGSRHARSSVHCAPRAPTRAPHPHAPRSPGPCSSRGALRIETIDVPHCRRTRAAVWSRPALASETRRGTSGGRVGVKRDAAGACCVCTQAGRPVDTHPCALGRRAEGPRSHPRADDNEEGEGIERRRVTIRPKWCIIGPCISSDLYMQ
jgi:hypothetical protein